MSTNAAANTQTEAKKINTKIEIPQNLEFDANIKSMFINTIELTSLVDSMFGPAMRDYVGCKITLNTGNLPGHIASEIPLGKFYVSLYFKDRSSMDGKCPIENVIPRSKTPGKTKFDSLMMMSGASAGRMYDITPETYDALDDYRFNTGRKANWAMLTSEVPSNFGFNGSYQTEIVACITGIDLEKIINAAYGTRTEEGIFQYQAVPVQIVANVNGEYVVQITQLDVTKLDELRKSLGGPIASTEFHRYVR